MQRPFERSPFVTIHAAFLICGIYFLVAVPKGDLFLFINQHQLPATDIFFKYITHLGDGLMFLFLLIFLLFIRYSYAILMLTAALLQSVLMLILKQWIFQGMPRPKAWFPDDITLNFINGVDVHSYNTFPSGHTATAFTVFALLAWIFKEKNEFIGVACFLTALAVGFSRIYLGQHFFADVYFGSIVGVISVIFAMPLYRIIEARDPGKRLHGSLSDHFMSAN